MTPTCPYCQQPSVKTTGSEVYPHRADLKAKVLYLCRPCRAWVGCHPGTDKPLGRLANATLRVLKMSAHAAFDPLWREGRMTRQAAYAWLDKQLQPDRGKCHIGMFDEIQCQAVVDAVAALLATDEVTQ